MPIRFWLIGLLLTLGLAWIAPAQAQSSLAYGTTVLGQTDAQYQFSGSVGDLIVAEALGVSANFTPTLSLIDPLQHQAAQGEADPLTPGSTVLTYRLPADGAYTLSVSGSAGASGQFVLTLNGRPISAAEILSPGQTSIPLGTTPQVYQFGGPAEIDLSAANFDFRAELRDQQGRVVAQLDGVPRAAFETDSGGVFELTLQAGSPGVVDVQYVQRPDLLVVPTAAS